MNKKAYIFLVDGIVAIIILTIGFLLISANRPISTLEAPLSQYSENTLQLLSSVRIYDLCDTATCTCTNPVLQSQCSFIENKNQSILDYFGELHDKNQDGAAENLFRNLTLQYDLLRQDIFGVEFRIDDDLIYRNAVNSDDSTDLISSKRLIFGYYEDRVNGNIYYWGPYITEVNIWQK